MSIIQQFHRMHPVLEFHLNRVALSSLRKKNGKIENATYSPCIVILASTRIGSEFKLPQTPFWLGLSFRDVMIDCRFVNDQQTEEVSDCRG
jgi:hypothetical protein